MFKFKSFMKYLFILFFSSALICQAQIENLSWKKITELKDENWFETPEANKIANQVLLYQKDIGGWPKNVEMHVTLSEEEAKKLNDTKLDPKGCTIDNGATVQELIFLSKIYQKQPDEKYKIAFLKGLLYLISAQYKNGGWPQFYPLKEGYYSHITYNDNAMVNVLMLFNTILYSRENYPIPIPTEILNNIENAFNKGIDCILKTQYKQNGVLTAWCAQHDKTTLEPAKARAYELPSLSGKESAKIVLLLMSIENPSDDVKNSIEAAVRWFDKTKIIGYKLETIETSKKGETDKILIETTDLDPLWARFMELNDNTPFFCDRNGKKKYNISEISHERRNGYGWYTNEPKEVFKKYIHWRKLNK